jgi:TRAP-type uncharacterized transport system fused permease subunit
MPAEMGVASGTWGFASGSRAGATVTTGIGAIPVVTITVFGAGNKK